MTARKQDAALASSQFRSGYLWLIALAMTSSTLVSVGCRRSQTQPTRETRVSATASASAPPVDRLLPGELGSSSELVFGFPVPVGMSVERVFPDAVHLVGEVTISGLVDYIRKHAQVGTAELTGGMMRFDQVRIPHQAPDHLYRFELVQQARQVRLVIKNITPPPTQPGLTEEERWRQAGLTPNGQPLDLSKLR